ncbi:MAG TPA: ADP-ribosylglycohydrolase family protein, partial [Candidatus Limnocylindrales bacterium]|nr:ADP-ribosylglycohydrolase family protein [Candidatus Limnocylindrales bacterium]
SHTGNGIYAAMWAAGANSVAVLGASPEDIVHGGLAQVPPASRLYEAVASAAEMYATGSDWDPVMARLHRDLDRYGWVHAINNTAAISAAVLWGGGDFGRTIGLAVAAGWDTDSCGATAGAIAGAAAGGSRLPPRWVDPLEDRLETAIAGSGALSISELATRTARLATSGHLSA